VRPLRPLVLNTLSFWLWGFALISFGLFAATATQRYHADLQRRESARFEASTQQAMELWERQVLDAASTWLIDFESAGDFEAFDRSSREDIPWMDSFYLWDTRERQLIHPRAPTHRPEGSEQGCLAEVERDAPVLPPQAEAIAYLGCLPAPPATDVLITQRASTLLIEAGQLEAARRALHAGQAPTRLSLDQGAQRGIPAPRLARWRLQHVQLLQALGQGDQALAQGRDLASDIAELDGPTLERLVDQEVPQLLELLVELGSHAEVARLRTSLERAQRRVDAWREVRDRLAVRTSLPDASDRPQLLRDPYGTPPFLLLFRRAIRPDRAVAIQLDEEVLVTRLGEMIQESYGTGIRVQDGSGRLIAGPARGPWRERQLTLPLVFEYLRVSLPVGAGSSAPARKRLLLVQLLPILLTVLMGTLALLARNAAIRRRLELESSRSEFVTRVTHELKTPLAGIRVMAEALELGAYRSPEEHTELAQRILNESERLAQRVDEVLNMSRAPTDFRFGPTDISELCHEAADRWRGLMDQNQIELVLDIHELPMIMAQQSLLRDALSALLENAIKYRDPTRPSVVRLEGRVVGRRWIQIEVLDNGIGVPADKRKHIFEPFARVEGPGRGRSGGHGLGLSFVANAARVHRGRAECREGIEGGTRFVLRIRRTT
jgi:signal transduction histidine kinase